jgi:hypothetical protein
MPTIVTQQLYGHDYGERPTWYNQIMDEKEVCSNCTISDICSSYADVLKHNPEKPHRIYKITYCTYQQPRDK